MEAESRDAELLGAGSDRADRDRLDRGESERAGSDPAPAEPARADPGRAEPARRRRYGRELEAALLEAGWDELAEHGYARMTMESVAVRARTSEAVLYRRWANKDRLVMAAIDHHRSLHPVVEPDTGVLRDDLIALLTSLGEALAGVFAIVAAAAFSGLLADTGLTPSQARDEMLGNRELPRDLYRRAHERGEIDLARVPPSVLELPFDLARHELMMDLRPIRPARVRAMVDELFMPLLRAYQAENAAGVKDSTLSAGGGKIKDSTPSAGGGKINDSTPSADGSEIKDSTSPVGGGEIKDLTQRSEVLRAILGAQRKAAEQWARDRDLTVEQATVIAYLERHPGAIQRDIAGATRTTAANVSLLLSGLERRGLVERRTESGGGRGKRVHATPAGVELAAGLGAVIARADAEVFAPLDDAERADLHTLLGKVAARLDP